MKRRTIYIFTVLLAIVLIAVEAYIIKVATNIEPVMEVVYSTKKIPAYTVITPDMVTKKRINISLVTLQTATNLENVIGKAVTTDIDEGEAIKTFRLVSPDSISEIKLLNSKNRLITVEFKPDQVNGWNLKTNSVVDIIYTPNNALRSLDAQKALLVDPFQKSLLEFQVFYDIRVAGILDEDGNVVLGRNKGKAPKLVSFEVTEYQAKFLSAAKDTGTLNLAVTQNDSK